MGELYTGIFCEARKRWSMRHKTALADRGQALVELALLVPFLVLLLIGALQAGIIAYAAIEVGNAAEAGALYGAQNRANASNTTGITQAAQNDASGLVTVGVTPSISCACQTASGTLTNITCSATTSCTSPSQVVEWVNVLTNSTINPTFHYPGLPTTYTVHGQATLRVAQQ